MDTYNEVDIAFISNVGIPSATATRKSDVHMVGGVFGPTSLLNLSYVPGRCGDVSQPRVTMSVPWVH